MTITYVGTSAATTEWATLPVGTAVGDVAIVEVTNTISAPTTATRLSRDNSINRHALIYKVLTSQDVANNRISTAAGGADYWGGSSGSLCKHITGVFRGVKSPPILLSSPDSPETSVQGSGTTLTMPLSGTTASSGMLVWAIDVYSALNAPTAPSGWTKYGGAQGSENVGFYTAIPVGAVPSAQVTLTCVNSGISAGAWHGAVLLRDNIPPTVTLSSLTTIDPRANNTISWTYSDSDGNPQSSYELDYRVSGGTWASLSTGTTASSYVIPADTLTDETDYEIRVRVNDGTVWSDYSTDTFRADSWTYYPEVESSSDSATISTATLDPDSDYEVQVKVSDGFHYSEWSLSADMIYTRQYVYDGGVWRPTLKRQYWIDSWKDGRSTNF